MITWVNVSQFWFKNMIWIQQSKHYKMHNSFYWNCFVKVEYFHFFWNQNLEKISGILDFGKWGSVQAILLYF